METKTVSTRIEPLLFLYDTHTDLFPNVIDGISDKDAHNRLNTKANHVAWLAGFSFEPVTYFSGHFTPAARKE